MTPFPTEAERLRAREACKESVFWLDEWNEVLLAFDRLYPPQPDASERNQCDGCRAGMSLQDGIHYEDGHPHICCTANRYVTPTAPEGEVVRTVMYGEAVVIPSGDATIISLWPNGDYRVFREINPGDKVRVMRVAP
jgi:hypothetical protein